MAAQVIPYRKYGYEFDTSHPVFVEMWMLQNTTEEPFVHHKALQQALWPELDYHRWTDLCLEHIVSHPVTVLLGAGSTGKTHEAAKVALSYYWTWPHETTILMSSTDIRSLRLRIWGETKKLYKLASERWPDLEAGKIMESTNSIVTAPDKESEDDTTPRDDRNGIICIPCMISGRYIGLGKYVGIKNKRVMLFGDELQFMGPTFLDAISNLNNNPVFKGVLMGNPVDPTDQLGKAGEPIDGWASIGEPTKTTTWKTRFMDGTAVNLVGTDSPNFDHPEDKKPRYPYLINQKHIDAVVSFWGKDSLQYYSQCVGIMKPGALGKRVLTREMATQHHAMEDAVWRGTERTRIASLDVAYGGVGGDRCVFMWGEFGSDVDGKQILRLNAPMIVPVSVSNTEPPEDQIASWLMDQLDELRIPPQNCAYDSTGRGSIGSAFARIFGHVIPVPIEFGGRPSENAVRGDLYIYDDKQRRRRLKLASEHYSKKVSELWFRVRYAVEADQIREMTEDVLTEFCSREWGMRAGNKIEIETKEDTRERMGRSPDLADAACVLLEIACQRGFVVQKLGQNVGEGFTENNLLAELARKWDKVEQSKRLTFR